MNSEYFNVIKDVYENGKEVSPRGMKVKELLCYSFWLNDPTKNTVSLKGFETNLNYAKKELEWYLSGTNKINFDPLLEKIWKKYSNDGETVQSAYGNYIFNQQIEVVEGEKLSQWEWAKRELIKDVDSRRAVININQPYHKAEKYSLDVPCAMYLQFLIRNNKLHLIANLRSNDLVLGVRNDVYCFTELQKKMADELGLSLGKYWHYSGSMHIYEKDWKKCEELLYGV